MYVREKMERGKKLKQGIKLTMNITIIKMFFSAIGSIVFENSIKQSVKGIITSGNFNHKKV